MRDRQLQAGFRRTQATLGYGSAVNLHRGLAAGSGEFLLFAITPPRLATSPPEAAEIGRVTLERLRPLAIDGLVLYDIDDESDRNPDGRPFPFLPRWTPPIISPAILPNWRSLRSSIAPWPSTRRIVSERRWTGNLTVELPGKAGYPLTGPGLRVTLERPTS